MKLTEKEKRLTEKQPVIPTPVEETIPPVTNNTCDGNHTENMILKIQSPRKRKLPVRAIKHRKMPSKTFKNSVGTRDDTDNLSQSHLSNYPYQQSNYQMFSAYGLHQRWMKPTVDSRVSVASHRPYEENIYPDSSNPYQGPEYSRHTGLKQTSHMSQLGSTNMPLPMREPFPTIQNQQNDSLPKILIQPSHPSMVFNNDYRLRPDPVLSRTSEFSPRIINSSISPTSLSSVSAELPLSHLNVTSWLNRQLISGHGTDPSQNNGTLLEVKSDETLHSNDSVHAEDKSNELLNKKKRKPGKKKKSKKPKKQGKGKIKRKPKSPKK